jgi:hypothetical protein
MRGHSRGTTGKGSVRCLHTRSFITTAVLQRWRERHPRWRVIDNADANGRMRVIEVPQVQVGGYRVGRVCFAERPDKNFHEFIEPRSIADKKTPGTSRAFDRSRVGPEVKRNLDV